MPNHPTDVHVGQRIRECRVLRGISQEKLAEVCGVTFQQIQKNESGFNRVGASRLFQIAEALEVPVSYFFEGLGRSAPVKPVETNRESLELVRSFNRIRDPRVRQTVRSLINAVADKQVEPTPMAAE